MELIEKYLMQSEMNNTSSIDYDAHRDTYGDSGHSDYSAHGDNKY